MSADPHPSLEFYLSLATHKDLEQLMEIELLCFPHPWTKPAFVAEIERSFAHVVVMRHVGSDKIAAFIIYWLIENEVHILNLATHPQYHRRGLAKRLLDHTYEIALSTETELMTLEVRRSNQAAISLYTKQGFVSVGVRPKYYENGEDAIVMNFYLSPAKKTVS